MQSIEKRIMRKIQNSKSGSVFSAAQFLDIGSRQAVDVALHRLVKSNRLRRIRQGLYDLPRSHPIIGQTAPDPMAVVRAVMAVSNAQWQPSGAYAANLLRLSDQVPAKIVILTNGVPRQIRLGKLTLAFRRVSPRNLLGAGRTSGLVIQSLRHLGKKAVTSSVIHQLQNLVDDKTKKDLGMLLHKTPAWMRPIIEQIVGDK